MPVINTPIIKSLKEEFKPFAEEVILNNLPMIDGLLLAHKKVLWGMITKGVLPNKPFVKNIKNQGYIVEYYVYGDLPLGKVMVNMADNGINIPYLEWDGNSGDKYRKKGRPASPRYTGSRTTNYGVFMLKGIDKNAVPMKPNYDNTHIEPIIAPSIAPNVLLNNSESIAVSEASKIPPHNVNNVCDSLINYIKNKDIDSAINILGCPDFCNGGKIIYDKNTFYNIYKEGKGSFSLIGNYTYDEKKNMLYITEVPYTTTIDAIESTIIDKYEKGKFKDVLDTRDASGKDGLCLEIKLKKNTDIDLFIKQLRKETPFESKYSCNFTILGLDYIPYLMNLQGLYDTWTQHRINCIKSETLYDINKNKEELNKLYGLRILSNDLDAAIKIIRQSKSEKVAIENLVDYFKLNQKQAEYISTIRLVNINQEWINNKIKNINDLEQENIQLDKYYNWEEAIKETIISQLKDVKKEFGKPRKTEIIYPEEDIAITQEDLVEDNTVTICISKDGYIKKNLRYSENQKLKDGDEILQLYQTTNKTDLLFFTNKAKLYIRKTYDIQECEPSRLGEYIPNLLEGLEQDEKVIYTTATKDWSENLVCVFENGFISKMNLQKTKPQQNRKVAIEKIFNTESDLISISVIKEDIDVLLVTQSGHGLVISTDQVNAVTSKNGKGVVGIKLDTENMSDDKVIGVIPQVNQDTSFNLLTEKGKDLYIMLNDISPSNNKNMFNYLIGNRGRIGNFIYNTRQRNDKIISMTINK